MTELLQHSEDSSFDDELSAELAAIAAETEQPKLEPHNYTYLRHSTERGDESSEALRARYIRYTEKMIASVRDLAEPTAGVNADGKKDTGVTMVFLDKSARPTYWLMNELWDLYAPNYERPPIKFANIDREQWQDRTGRIDLDQGGFNVDVSRLPGAVFENLAQTYANPERPEESVFKDRKILIVDETMTTGTTLEIAEQLFQRSFPDAKEVDGHHWMVRPSGSKRTSEVPLWYNKDTPIGRGVADRDDTKSGLSASERQRVGTQFLSTRPDQHDSMADGLRREFHYIREDMLNGTQRFPLVFSEDDEVDPILLMAAQKWRKQ